MRDNVKRFGKVLSIAGAGKGDRPTGSVEQLNVIKVPLGIVQQMIDGSAEHIGQFVSGCPVFGGVDFTVVNAQIRNSEVIDASH